jgi:FkbM family methyltransferase
MLGVSELMSSQPEGLVHLHHARQLAPDSAPILQALYLGYRGIGDLNAAQYWLEAAHHICLNQNSEAAEWQWTKLAVDSAIAYVAFDQDLVLAVEPNFRSIVTGVLVAQGDWFEREIEFWRNGIQAGMTVIDVGANAGVYTFSAAQRVGATGLVLAIEPFSQCVAYLNETCRVNQFDWVKVCAGAASDRNGNAKLSLSSASELNELISEEEGQTRDASSFEEVECFTLDSLIEKYGVSRVDFLKIDAEGHELQVLKGCDRILTEFAPIILYENIAGRQGSNLPVADYLRSIGYQPLSAILTKFDSC